MAYFFWFVTKVIWENDNKLVNSIIIDREKPKINTFHVLQSYRFRRLGLHAVYTRTIFMPFTNLLLSERTLYSFDRKKLANQR